MAAEAQAQVQTGKSAGSVVLVTGFGPFQNHTVNASWAAVQELEKMGVQDANSQSVSLTIREIPVAYEAVKQTIPSLLTELAPTLCVHVGVSPYKTVVLEKCGRNLGYSQNDIYGKKPEGEVCVPGGPEYLQTTFDIPKVLQKVFGRQQDVKFATSSDAGRYLCDFIYYTSLYANAAPVLFVHVTSLEEQYTVQQLAKTLKNIIEVLLEEVQSRSEN